MFSVFRAVTRIFVDAHRRDVAQSELCTALTDRQQTILATAYNGEYFVWPRGSTAEEVADSADLVPPTLYEHVRDAERKLLEVYFDETDSNDLDSRPVD